jgi:hypothetical protein
MAAIIAEKKPAGTATPMPVPDADADADADARRIMARSRQTEMGR